MTAELHSRVSADAAHDRSGTRKIMGVGAAPTRAMAPGRRRGKPPADDTCAIFVDSCAMSIADLIEASAAAAAARERYQHAHIELRRARASDAGAASDLAAHVALLRQRAHQLEAAAENLLAAVSTAR